MKRRRGHVETVRAISARWVLLSTLLVGTAGFSARAAADTQDEPDFPADLSQPLTCPGTDEAKQNASVTVRCVTSDDLHEKHVTLFVRQPGHEDYTGIDMHKSPKGWYSAVIDSWDVRGKSLQYYVEARNRAGDVIANNGSDVAPNFVRLVENDAGQGKRVRGAQAAGSEDENPLLMKHTAEQETHEAPASFGRKPNQLWLGVAAGSGYGWHSEQSLETSTDVRIAAATTAVGPMHIAPEVGYQLTDRFALSLQGRVQILPQSSNGEPGGAHGTAVAVLGRALYDLWGTRDLHLYTSGMLGGGSAFRLEVPARPAIGIPTADTVRGGPLAGGGGLGLAYFFSANLGLTAEVNALVGAPTMAFTVDANLGVQVRL